MINILKPVDHSAKDIITEFLMPQTYKTCEYSFTTLFMWQHYYNTCYYNKENFLCLLGYQNGEYFSMLPLIGISVMPKICTLPGVADMLGPLTVLPNPLTC